MTTSKARQASQKSFFIGGTVGALVTATRHLEQLQEAIESSKKSHKTYSYKRDKKYVLKCLRHYHPRQVKKVDKL